MGKMDGRSLLGLARTMSRRGQVFPPLAAAAAMEEVT